MANLQWCVGKEGSTSQFALSGCVLNDRNSAVAIVSMPCNPLHNLWQMMSVIPMHSQKGSHKQLLVAQLSWKIQPCMQEETKCRKGEAP